MKLKTILRKMLLIMSIILFLLFYIAGLICVIDAYFCQFFYNFLFILRFNRTNNHCNISDRMEFVYCGLLALFFV